MPKDTCLCIDLRSAAQRLTQIYDDAMAPSGISVTQFSQLHIIRTLENPSLKALSAASQQDRSTLGRNVRVLEKMGLVQMKVGDDARTRTIHLTRKGQAVFKKAVPLWMQVQSELVARLGHSGRAGLDDMLETLKQPLAAR